MATFRSRIQTAVEERTGIVFERKERVELLEAAQADGKTLRRELDMLGWGVLDYMSQNPAEMTPQTRRELARKSRVVWMQDPIAGAAVDLMNDFVFGRGVPKPKAHDDSVQEVIDEAWDDPDNQTALTSYAAQIALGTDLSLQSNIFLLLFDDGKDGKIKLGMVDPDTVEGVVRDPDNRLRILYYMAKQRPLGWDFQSDAPKVDFTGNDLLSQKATYYEHWNNVKTADAEGRKIDKPPADKLGDGKVYHIAINRTTEQAFGVPTFRRILRYITAYNDFLKSRVDIAQAAASVIAKRKIKGTPHQLAKVAAKSLSRESDLAGQVMSPEPNTTLPPRNASIWNENESLELSPFNLSSGAGAAAQDAEILRGPISAATRFPGHYYGGEPGSLAGASASELPVLKAIEARQEVIEGAIRWFVDRVIEKAVDEGKLDKFADPEEDKTKDDADLTQVQQAAVRMAPNGRAHHLNAAHEDQGVDEERTERDLGYDFSMPSPLRRMMLDLVNSVTLIAKTFDPNATNLELSRILLNIALGEGLEVSDPGHAVDVIFPEGYVDPAVAAAQQPAPGDNGPSFFGPESAGMTTDPNSPGGPTDMSNNPYSAPLNSPAPEDSPILQNALVRDRNGDLVEVRQLPLPIEKAADGRKTDIDKLWEEDVLAVVHDELVRLTTNGNGSG